MKGILLTCIIAALVVTAVESLSCVQCNSLTNSCVNSSITGCPSSANVSCTSFLANSSLAAAIALYQDKACSAENCREGRDMVEAFTVHVSGEERFHFTSQCCQGKECNDTSDALAPLQEDMSNNTECLACYGSNETSCSVKSRKCYKEERCVSLVAEFKTVPRKSSKPNGIKCSACYNVHDISCDPVLLTCTGTETKCVEVIGIDNPIFLIFAMGCATETACNLKNISILNNIKIRTYCVEQSGGDPR